LIKKRWCREGFGAFGNPHRFGITFPCSKTFSRPTFLHFSGFPGGEYITQGVNISRRGRIYHPGEEYITQGENISPRGRIYHPGGEYITQGENISPRGRIYHPGGDYITQGENISPRG
jgi:hypothetical protein